MVVVTLVVPVVLVLMVVARLFAIGAEYQGDIEHLDPRVARLRGTLAVETQLIDAAARAKTSIGRLGYPAGDTADAIAATLQTDVRGIMSDAGLVVTDSQIEAVQREDAFEVIGLTVSVAGDINTLEAALEAIAAYAPRLLVTNIDVSLGRVRRRGNAPSDGPQPLAVKMSLLSSVAAE